MFYFFIKPFDFAKIKSHCKKFILIHSDNDPYVKPYHAKYFANKLEIGSILMGGKKHFNLEAGEDFKRFPQLLSLIKNSL